MQPLIWDFWSRIRIIIRQCFCIILSSCQLTAWECSSIIDVLIRYRLFKLRGNRILCILSPLILSWSSTTNLIPIRSHIFLLDSFIESKIDPILLVSWFPLSIIIQSSVVFQFLILTLHRIKMHVIWTTKWIGGFSQGVLRELNNRTWLSGFRVYLRAHYDLSSGLVLNWLGSRLLLYFITLRLIISLFCDGEGKFG